MAQSLRKYLSNRGSALFMVLSTMTALMVTCMAMYFAVLSSRSAGFAIFNQQQSYQSAISISEMAVGSLNDLVNNAGVSIESVPVGGTILTTDGNSFKALNPSASNADDTFLGAYDVTMTRLADEKMDGKTFLTVDIAVTTSVSGVKEIYHQVINVIQENGSPNQKGKIFASTGYVPNDSFVSKGSFYSDIYISNEDVVFGAYNSDELHFFQNMYCENSLTVLDDAAVQNYSKKPIVHAVRGNYNIGSGNPIEYKGGSTILVGGDMHLGRKIGPKDGGKLEVYISGDLYFEDTAKDLNSRDLKIYVAGNVYVKSNANNCIPGVVYCNKAYSLTSTPIGSYSKEVFEENNNDDWWSLDQDKPHGHMSMSFKEAMEMLDRTTPNIQYKLWKIDEGKLGSEVGKTQTDGSISGGRKLDINFSSINNQNVYKPYVITYGSKEHGSGCIIKDITVDRDTEDSKMPTLIIDTGDKTSNTYTIRLQANNSYDPKPLETDPKKKKIVNYFTWRPKKPDGNYASLPIQVLIKGKGSVVFDVPDGVVYQDVSSCHILHYNWYILGDNNSGYGYENSEPYLKNSQGIQGTLSDYVHSFCGEGCGCHYDIKKTKDKCVYCDGEDTYTVKCNKHEEYTICPNCDPNYFSGDPKKPTIDPAGICKDRVENKKCIDDLKIAKNGGKPIDEDDDGNPIVPHCNIYLVSCSESADFRFGHTIDDKGTIDKNCFIGYIYAPYMSYKANGRDAGEYYMHMGGMVVSDYKFLSKNRFIACWPSVYPPQNVFDEDSMNSTLNPVSEKRYRVKLKATY